MYPQQKLQKDTTGAQSFTTIREENTRLLQSLHAQQRKEPIPSATDAKPNVTMSIAEIADFSSTIVYLIWHARRQSVMDLHSSSKAGQVIVNNFKHTKATADMANMTSAAFKKFCRQAGFFFLLFTLFSKHFFQSRY